MIVICLTTDVCGSLALVYEAPESNIMEVPPRDVRTSKLVDWRLIFYAYMQIGIPHTLVAFSMFFYAMYYFSGGRITPQALAFAWETWTNEGNYHGTTMEQRANLVAQGQSAYFVALVLMQISNLVFNARTIKCSTFSQTRNAKILAGVAGELAIIFIVVYIPAVNQVFATAPLPYQFFLMPLAAGAVILGGGQEFLKLLRRRYPVIDRSMGF